MAVVVAFLLHPVQAPVVAHAVDQVGQAVAIHVVGQNLDSGAQVVLTLAVQGSTRDARSTQRLPGRPALRTSPWGSAGQAARRWFTSPVPTPCAAASVPKSYFLNSGAWPAFLSS